MLLGSIGTTHTLSSLINVIDVPSDRWVTDQPPAVRVPLGGLGSSPSHYWILFSIVTVLQVNNIYSQTHWGLSSQQNKQEIKAAAGTFAAIWIFIFTSDCRSDILMTLVLLFWLGVWVSWCINNAQSFCRRVCSSRVCLCFVFRCIRFEMRLRRRGQIADS